MSNIIIRPGKMPESITITDDWIARRDELLNEALKIETIDNDAGYNEASRLLNEATKTSNQLERMRKSFSAPFLEAQRVIKKAADDAREPLEDLKRHLQKPMTVWVQEKRRRYEEEQRLIAEEQQRKAEKAFAQAQEEEELFGDVQTDIEIEAPETAVETLAKSSTSRTVDEVVFEVVDPDAVPRAFCKVDERKINAYKRDQKERILAAIKVGKDGALIEGVKWTIETKIIGRG